MQKIPGIATVGPLFRPVIEIGAKLSAKVDFTYGFDLTVRFSIFVLQFLFYLVVHKGQQHIRSQAYASISTDTQQLDY